MQRLLFSILSMCLVPITISAQTLRGSPASVNLMYTRAHEKNLAFLHTRADIYYAARAGDLKLLTVNPDLTLYHVRYPFVLPYTKRFADSLAVAFHAECGERLVVTSGARPMAEQPRNASPKSVHPTGMAVDFRKPRTEPCLGWMRERLLGLELRGVIEATEERHPPHFHVAVLREEPLTPRYIASATPATAPAGAPRVSVAAGEVVPKPAAHAFAAPTAARAAMARPKTYRVRAGDNLTKIALEFATTSKVIQALNRLTSSRLRVGQELKLP